MGPVTSAPARRVSTFRRAASARIVISSARARSAAASVASFAATRAALHAASTWSVVVGMGGAEVDGPAVNATSNPPVDARNDARAARVFSWRGDSRYSSALTVSAGCMCGRTW